MIPTFNEAGNVEHVIRAAMTQLERVVPGDHQVLIVDDASPDGTADIAERLAAEVGSIEVLRRLASRVSAVRTSLASSARSPAALSS